MDMESNQEQQCNQIYEKTDALILKQIEKEIFSKIQPLVQRNNQDQNHQQEIQNDFFSEENIINNSYLQHDFSSQIISSGRGQNYLINPNISRYTQQKNQNIQEIDQKKLFKRVLNKKNKKSGFKNNNIPKFIIQIFLQQGKRYLQQFEEDQDIKRSVYILINKEKRNKKKEKNINNNIKDIQKIFGVSQCNNSDCNNFNCKICNKGLRKSFLMRKTLNKILRNHLTSNVIQNPQVKYCQEYLKCLKIYALRIRNISLLTRLQSK